LHSPERARRVLVLTSTFPRRDDDTEPRFVLDLCKHLSEYADIRVLAPHAPGAKGDDTIEGVSVRRFRYFLSRYQAIAYEGGILARLRQNPWRILQLPMFLAALFHATRKMIREWEPDIVHAHWIVPQGLVACLAAPKRIPVLCTSHGGDLHGLQAPPFRWAKTWTLNRCTAITVVSDSMVPAVRALAAETRVDVIPMGTDLRSLFVPPRAGTTRENDAIVFVGRLVEKKGLPVLVEAFAKLRRSLPDARLTIVGDGPMRAPIESLLGRLGLSEHVSLAGALPHRELADVYRRSTVAVFPFVVAAGGDQEGFGLVVTEAMGCGCPVIASELPAVRASIDPGTTGILVPPGDADALEREVLRVLRDAPLRERLSSAALDSARRRFDWPVIAKRYWDAIQQCLGEPAAKA
jgi:glycosyltransferase involved in cell wall biosynthesis